MCLSELKLSELKRIKAHLDTIPKEKFAIEDDDDYEVMELDLDERTYNAIVEMTGSTDEKEISYTINRLLHQYLEDHEAP